MPNVERPSPHLARARSEFVAQAQAARADWIRDAVPPVSARVRAELEAQLPLILEGLAQLGRSASARARYRDRGPRASRVAARLDDPQARARFEVLVEQLQRDLDEGSTERFEPVAVATVVGVSIAFAALQWDVGKDLGRALYDATH